MDIKDIASNDSDVAVTFHVRDSQVIRKAIRLLRKVSKLPCAQQELAAEAVKTLEHLNDMLAKPAVVDAPPNMDSDTVEE